MMTAHRLVMLFAALLFVPSYVSATCYWANSTLAPDSQYSIAPDDTACFPNQNNSPCCGTGWTCLSDGVCYIEQQGEGFYYRGTCTDRTWDSQQCPGWCFAENSNTSIPLAKCSTSDGEDWYCCPGDPDCDCSSGKDAVKLGASQPTTVTVIGSTTWSGMQASTSLFSTSAFSNTNQNTGASTAASTSVVAGTTNGTSPSASQTASSTGSGGAGSSAATGTVAGSSQSLSSTSSHTGLAAGLGAGLGVAAIAIATLAFFLFRRRRSSRAAARAGTQPLTRPPANYSEMTGSAPTSAYASHAQEPNPDFYGGKYGFQPSTEMAADGSHQRLEIGAGQPANGKMPGHPDHEVRYEMS